MANSERAVERRPIALLAVVGAAYYGSYLTKMPFNFGDEGYLYYVADALGHGQTPYHEVRLFAYLPGLFYLLSPLLRWEGHEIVLARSAMLAGLVGKAILLYLCTRRLTCRRVAAGAALVTLLVPGVWHKFYIGLLALLILWTLMSYLGRPGTRTACFAGLSVGAALVLRMDVALTGIGLLGAVLALRVWQWRKAARRWVAAELLAAPAVAVAVTLPVQLLLLSKGVAAEHARQWWDFAGLAVRRTSAPLRLAPPPLESLLDLDRLGAHAWVYYGALAVVVGYLAVFLRPRAAWISGPARDTLAPARPGLVGLWTLGYLPQLALERPDVPHVTQYAFAFIVPASILVERILTGRGPPGRRVTGLCAGLVAALFVAKHLWLAQGGSAGVLHKPASWVTLSNGFTYPSAPSRPGEPSKELLEILVSGSTPRDRIAALPYLPGAAFVTRRRLFERDIYLVPHSMTGPEVEADYLSALKTRPPRFVLYHPGRSLNNRPSGRLAAYSPAVDAHLRKRFRVVARERGMWVMEPSAPSLLRSEHE